MSNAGRNSRRRPASRSEPRETRPVSSRGLEVPMTLFAPRATVLALAVSVVACVVGALTVAGWLDATDTTDATASSSGQVARDLLTAAGLGALVGLVAGVIAAILAAWGSMLLRSRLARGRRTARVATLSVTTLLWVLGLHLVLHAAGFGGVGLIGFALGLPALLVALVLVWCWTPWLQRAGGPGD